MNDTTKAALDAVKTKGAETSKQEEEFQQYKSAKPSIRLITEKGFRITFTNYTYLTQNEDAIAYLDRQIEAGLQGVTKGEVLTTSDLNPMAKLRKELEAQIRAEMAEEAKNAALGITRDMGETEAKAGIKVATAKDVAR